jgi:hypothetical protein
MPEQTKELWDDSMTRATDSVVNEAAAASSPRVATGKAVCPYCGAINERSSAPCPRCTMEDTPSTRAATKARIGPWYVLQSRNPSAPGMKWSTLLSLVNRGQVTPRSIVRGPTTHQLWRFAAHVKGLSREFGLCYSCGQDIEKIANQCPHCDRLQEPPINPDALLETREPAPRPAPVQREIRNSDDQPEPAAKAELAVREEEFPRDWKPDAGILSAKELAAAFQLDFNPSTSKAPAVEPIAPVRRRSGGKIFALLLALAAGGGAALMYFKPEYRQQAMGQWNNLTGWVHSKWDSLSAPKKPNPLDDLKNSNETPVRVEPVQDKPEPIGAFTPKESPPAAVEQPAVEPAQDATPPVTPQQPALDPGEQARQWWSAAQDAEQNRRYAEAIAFYEKIKTLPPDVWQSNLELRLQLAKDQLNK